MTKEKWRMKNNDKGNEWRISTIVCSKKRER